MSRTLALLLSPGPAVPPALPVSPWPGSGSRAADQTLARGDGQAAASPPALAVLPAPPPDEAALRCAALAGDAASWSALIARYNHKVVVSVLARGVPLERAKEIAQETWLRLIENQRAGRLQELVLPGLAIVQAGYLAANARRSASRDERAQDERAHTVAAAAHAAAPVPPEEHAIGRQRLAQLERALATCPTGARRVFEFVYAHPELTYDELARELQLSAQRVKQIVCEVRKRLRAALLECEP